MSSATQTTPEVVWAQRSSKHDEERNSILLTIAAPDIPPKSLKVDLKPTSLTFTGHSETKKTTYHVELVFYEEIDPEKSQTHHTSRDVIFKLRKKELKEEYWPRLLKDSKRVHFLKTDFDKWVDEDEQDAAPDDDLPGGMGGMGGGMPGMEGMGGEGGFGGIDFSKLGGGAGAGGMPDMGDLGGDEDDEDEDNEMPDLEDEGEEEGGKGKGKEEEADEEPAGKKIIEEVS